MTIIVVKLSLAEKLPTTLTPTPPPTHTQHTYTHTHTLTYTYHMHPHTHTNLEIFTTSVTQELQPCLSYIKTSKIQSLQLIMYTL